MGESREKEHKSHKPPNIAHIKEYVHTQFPLRNQRDRKDRHDHHPHMHLMPPNNSPGNRSNKISMPQLRRTNHLAMLQMPKVRETLSLPKMQFSGSIGTFMGPSICVCETTQYFMVAHVVKAWSSENFQFGKNRPPLPYPFQTCTKCEKREKE